MTCHCIMLSARGPDARLLHHAFPHTIGLDLKGFHLCLAFMTSIVSFVKASRAECAYQSTAWCNIGQLCIA